LGVDSLSPRVLKKLIAIVACLGILLQTFSQVVIVAEYYANKDYIAKNLCENRDKPMMHCNGKCCLKKKLAKEAGNQAPSPRNQKSEQAVNLFCSDTKFEIQSFNTANVPNRYFSHNDLRTFSFHSSVFHPPSA
jgi:hypothetical protein